MMLTHFDRRPTEDTGLRLDWSTKHRNQIDVAIDCTFQSLILSTVSFDSSFKLSCRKHFASLYQIRIVVKRVILRFDVSFHVDVGFGLGVM